jgi:FkbM family methyltransferase
MFISYAQNFEDVMLWRALKHIEVGFYLDVGAQDPVIDSVSRGFYEKGWRGVHLEPTSEYAAKLRKNRPDETVLENAVGEVNGSIRFFEFPETGLSTGDITVAAQHKTRGFQCRETEVELVSLDTLFTRFEGQQIHWMKIDVEGMEGAVLTSWAENPTRPWIVVIEATNPLSQERTETAWQHHLTDRDYELCYFDGLNCYFVSKQHPELKGAFSTPPNLFDDFSLSGTGDTPISALMRSRLAEKEDTFDIEKAAAQEREAALLRELSETRKQDAEKQHMLDMQKAAAQEREVALLQELSEVRKQAETFHHQILSLHESFCWQITAPYRVLSRAVKRGHHFLISSLPILRRVLKRSLRYTARLLVKFVQGNPQLYGMVRRLINSHPALRKLATRILHISGGLPDVLTQTGITDKGQMHKVTNSNQELETLSRVGRMKARQICI